jgi:hypothetical protein
MIRWTGLAPWDFEFSLLFLTLQVHDKGWAVDPTSPLEKETKTTTPLYECLWTNWLREREKEIEREGVTGGRQREREIERERVR